MPISRAGSGAQYSATQSFSARHSASAGSRSVTAWIMSPNVGYSATASMKSIAMSSRRGPGSVPPRNATGASDSFGV